MLSLEKTFREQLLEKYRVAPIDIPSFHRNYKVCAKGECAGLCCNGGAGFYMDEEPETIRRLVDENKEFFAAQGLSLPEKIFDEELDEDTGKILLSTNIRENVSYPPGLLPPHFPATACIFKRDDGACTLQTLGVEQGKHGWSYKPLACWLFPLELERDGKPFISVAHASTDEYTDDEYPGFTAFTKCGAECASGGKPAYEVLAGEITELSRLLDRDLLSEIMNFKESAA